MFVVEVANSQSIEAVRDKIGHWLLCHGARTGLILKVDLLLADDEGAIDSLKLSYEMWRAREVDWKDYNEMDNLNGKALVKASKVLYDKDRDAMWIKKMRATAEDGTVLFAMLFASGGPYDVAKVRDLFVERSTFLIAARNHLNPAR